MQHPSFSHVLGTPLLVHEKNSWRHILSLEALFVMDFSFPKFTSITNKYIFNNLASIGVFIHLLVPVYIFTLSSPSISWYFYLLIYISV